MNSPAEGAVEVAGELRIALVGAGEVTEHKHLRAFREVRGARVVALVDKDAARCARVADRYGIKQRLTDAREVFSLDVADIVGILTPPGTHAELAVEALRHGRMSWSRSRSRFPCRTATRSSPPLRRPQRWR